MNTCRAIGFLIGVSALAAPLMAQTASTARSARSAYGARLLAPEGVEDRGFRLSTRVDSRVSNRLSTRVERYSTAADPLAPLRRQPDDGTRRPIQVETLPQAEDVPD